MKKVLVLILLAIMITFFGCTGNQPKSDSNNVKADNPKPPDKIPDTKPAINYQNKAYAELLALNVPIQCDIDLSSDNPGAKSAKGKLYIKAKGNVRLDGESPDVPAGSCKTVIFLLKDNNYYLGCPDGGVLGKDDPKGCMWATNADSSGGAATFEEMLKAIPLNKISNCGAWVVDQSKFDIVGKVCSIDNSNPS